MTNGAVGNWRKRFSDFPQPVQLPHVVGIPLYDLAAVLAWAARHDRFPV